MSDHTLFLITPPSFSVAVEVGHDTGVKRGTLPRWWCGSAHGHLLHLLHVQLLDDLLRLHSLTRQVQPYRQTPLDQRKSNAKDIVTRVFSIRAGEHLTCPVSWGEVVKDRRKDGSQHGGSRRTVQSISSLQLHAALGLFSSVMIFDFCVSVVGGKRGIITMWQTICDYCTLAHWRFLTKPSLHSSTSRVWCNAFWVNSLTRMSLTLIDGAAPASSAFPTDVAGSRRRRDEVAGHATPLDSSLFLLLHLKPQVRKWFDFQLNLARAKEVKSNMPCVLFKVSAIAC